MKKFLPVPILLSIFLSFYSLPKAYVYNGHKWQAAQRIYYVNASSFVDNSSNPITSDQVINDITVAANAWTTQTSANFQFVYGGTTTSTGMKNDGISTVFADPGTSPYGNVAEVYWWYDGTGYLVDADMKVWITFLPWFTSDQACASGEWIYQVATHEFGHWLSLAHSDVVTATMHSGIGYCDTSESSLDPDDISAINTIYGLAPNPSPSPSPSPTPAPTPFPSPPPPPPDGAFLTVRAYKVKGSQRADLSWTGITTPTSDIFRNNLKIQSNRTNTGAYTDNLNRKGNGNYTYKVCEFASTENCTNSVQISF